MIKERKMSKLVTRFLVRILIFKFNIRFLDNNAKNLLRPDYIYKFMTLLPNDYYLISGNGSKNLLRLDYIYKFMTLLQKNCYLIPDNDAKNLLRPFV